MNNDVLMKRVMTAVVGIIIILTLMIYIEWGMTVLALLCAGIALFEYFVMVFQEEDQRLQRWVSIILGVLMIVGIIFQVKFLYELMSIFFLLLFIFYLSLTHFRGVSEVDPSAMPRDNLRLLFTELAFSLSGIFYIGFFFSFWPKIRNLEDGVYWIFLVFVIPWLSDTAGYFVGRAWGKTHFSVASPHKTLEGSIAGIILATLGVCIYKTWFFDVLSWADCVALGVGGSVISQLGDLFESFIKRALSVKDSGVIIPGHGGILDRFDSVLFCGPFIYFYSLL